MSLRKILIKKLALLLDEAITFINLRSFFMAGPLNGEGVRDVILSQGKEATESAAYFWGNVTKSV